jgi:hypothetical protein
VKAAGLLQGHTQHRPPVEGVRTLPRFDLDMRPGVAETERTHAVAIAGNV